MNSVIKYSAIRNQLQTGDLVLFSGETLFSLFIRIFTVSPYSHIGIVMIEEDVRLWESAKRAIKDHKGKLKAGVRLTTLSDRIAGYEGEVFIRQLNKKLEANAQTELRKIREELKNRPYERDTAELIKAGWDGPFGGNTEDLSSIFCSELVAEAYQRVGLLLEVPSGSLQMNTRRVISEN